MVNRVQLLQFIRTLLLTVVGTAVTSRGLMTSGMWEQFVGAALVILGLGLDMWDSRKSKIIAKAASLPETRPIELNANMPGAIELAKQADKIAGPLGDVSATR